MIQTSTDHGPSPLLSYTFFVRKFKRCYDSKIFTPAVQQSHDGVACFFFRFIMVRCSRFRRNANASSRNLDQARSALDKCPDSPLVYINPSSSGAPPSLTSSAIYDLPLFHPCFPRLSSLRVSNVMGLLTFFRLVCYITLVGLRHVFIQTTPIDPDAFPSGCFLLARWGWLLQGYTTLSTSHHTIPSTTASTSTVRNLSSSSLLG